MLVYALPLVPNTLFWWLGTSINRFFITGMLGIGASGFYAAASKIPNLLNLAYSIFQQAWQLSTFQEYRKSDIGKFFSMILIPLQAVLTVGASFIILIWQIAGFIDAAKEFLFRVDVIPVVLLGFYFSCMNTFYGTVYTTMKTKYLMTTTIVGSLVCVIATAGLIPVLGLYGAGAASILCNAVIYVMRMDKFKTPCVNRCELLHIGYFHCAVRRVDDDYCDGGSILLGLWRIDISRIDWHTRYAMCAFAAACCRQRKTSREKAMQSTTTNAVFLECYLAHNVGDDLFFKLSSALPGYAFHMRGGWFL